MITAFQRTAFQDNAFQIGVTVRGGGDLRWAGLPGLWAKAKAEAEARRKREEKEREQEEIAAAVAVELVTAQAAPVVTDLSALAVVAPTEVMARIEAPREDIELQQFLALMVKIAQSEEEFS